MGQLSNFALPNAPLFSRLPLTSGLVCEDRAKLLYREYTSGRRPDFFVDLKGPLPSLSWDEFYESLSENGSLFTLLNGSSEVICAQLFNLDLGQRRAAFQILASDPGEAELNFQSLRNEFRAIAGIAQITRLYSCQLLRDSDSKAACNGAILSSLGFRSEGILKRQIYLDETHLDLEIFGWSALWNR